MKKNETKRIRPLVFSFSLIDLAISFLFFHVVFKISNFEKQNAKYLAQASCTEFYFNLKNERKFCSKLLNEVLFTCNLWVCYQRARYCTAETPEYVVGQNIFFFHTFPIFRFPIERQNG